MNRSSCTRLVGFLFFACTLFRVASTQTSSSSSSAQQTCPAYRFFDTENPDTPIYGAPDGCRCFLGLSGLNCGYCDSDEPCLMQNSNSICRKDFVASVAEQTSLAYSCRLYNTLGSLFTNGKASFFLDLQAASVSLSLFDTRSVDDNRTVDCTLDGCKFQGKNTTCASAHCNCTGMCNPWVKQLVIDLAGTEAEITAEGIPPQGREDHHVTLFLDGTAFIEASCTARACASVGGLVEDTGSNPDQEPLDISDFFPDSKDEGTPPEQSTQEDSGLDPATLAIILICVLLASAVAVGLALVPYLCRTHVTPDSTKYALTTDTPPEDQQPPARKHVLQFRNLTRTIPLKGDAARSHGQTEKVILHDISGSVESGTMLGIMGQSGAGKSSLLNVLAAVETSTQARVSGHIWLNGREPLHGYRHAVAYVHQDDALYGTLTVRECIEYSALMRLPRTMSHEDKEALVWRTLEELHLTAIAHNRIGSSGRASVSGGERKRVSIGMELVANPTVLALDEPTSGLDSSAANKIMNVLADLASRNRIVILSIHQPSMKAFLLLDRVLLLGGGTVVYSGKPSEVKLHLEGLGFSCPDDETVADYMLEVASDETNLKILRTSGATASGSSKEESTNDGDLANQSFEELSDKGGTFLNEISVLFGRTGKDTIRNMELFLLQLGISILVACFGGAIFNNVSNDLAGFQNRMGAFYFSLSFFGFASFSSMDIFVKERHIFERETGAKMFRAFSYFVAVTAFDVFVLRIIPVTIFSFVFYWIMGLSSDFEKFMIFWAAMILFNVCAGVISICISIAAQTVGQANLIAVVWFLIMLLFGGFLINIDSMSSWYAWLKYLSIYFYTFEILITNELNGLLLQFDAPGFPTVPVYGDVFVETLGMNVDNQTRNMLCMCCLILGYFVLAYLLLLLRVPPSPNRYFRSMQKETQRRNLNAASGPPITVKSDAGSGIFTEQPNAGAEGL